MAAEPPQLTADAQQAVDGLADLDKKVGKKYVRKALRAAAKPTLTLSKSTAPEQTGRLKRAVKLRSAGVKQGTFKMTVGVGKKDFTGSTFYGAFVAMGHRVGRRQLGNSRKLVPGNEWLDHAYEETKDGAIVIFGETITALIESNQ